MGRGRRGTGGAGATTTRAAFGGMPKEGEICINCGKEIVRGVPRETMASGEISEVETLACLGPCLNPVGPSDFEHGHGEDDL
jgi:hypothetical protein